MSRSPILPMPIQPLAWLVVASLAACQSSPSRLYLLNAQAAASPETVAIAMSAFPASGLRLPVTPAAVSASAIGVAVTVPQYLDRTDVVERTGGNELTTSPDVQWGEDLSVDAARVLAEDLAAELPSVDFIMLPSRSRRLLDYEVDVELTRFETDATGRATARGWWSISNAAGQPLTSGRISSVELPDGKGSAAMVAVLSRALASVSVYLGKAIHTLLPNPNAAARSDAVKDNSPHS